MNTEHVKAYLSEKGFYPSEIPLDQSKVYRFAREGKGKRNCWLVGFSNYQTDTGKAYIVCVFGDWSTGEEYTYVPGDIQFSKQDRDLIEKNIRNRKIKAEKERISLQREAQAEAIQYFQDAVDSIEFPYLKSKKIDALYGAKIYKGPFDKQCLIIPMRDSNGTLWGLQRIYPDGMKYFLSGQRVDGMFHTLGEDIKTGQEPSLILCEGFATGVAIHRATGAKVVVCFSSGNLEKVARILKSENKECLFLIAGDDDRFTKNKDGEDWNPGRDAAEKAAAKCMGKTVFPIFQWGNETGTDFDDLFQESGLEVVKKQIEAVKLNPNYVRCLGHRNGSYYYTTSSNQEISILKSHNMENLLGLMPMSYWQILFEKKSKKEDAGNVDWGAAASELKERCRARGIFHVENLRGHGVWMDEGRVVVHLGDRLWVDGVEKGIHDIKTQFNYELIARKKSIHSNPLEVSECNPILKFLDGLILGAPDQKMLLGGWMIASQISGILAWRPHLFLSAESGSGKSTLLDLFIRPLLGEHCRFVSGERTTEAGIRQLMNSNVFPLLIDEFDLYGNSAETRSDSVLGLIRQASSGTGEIIQGSATGKHVQYFVRFSTLVSAVKNTTFNRQADATRFLQVEIKKAEDRTQWENIRGYLKLFNQEYSERLFARILDQISFFEKNNEAIRLKLIEKYSQRFAQLYSPVLAGWALLIQDGLLSDEQVTQLCDQVQAKEIEEKDHELVWGHILGQKIRTDTYGEMTVSAILSKLEELQNEPYLDRVLQTYGIRKMDKSVFVYVRSPQIQAFFKGTDWSNSYSELLTRVGTKKKYRVDKITQHGVEIPY